MNKLFFFAGCCLGAALLTGCEQGTEPTPVQGSATVSIARILNEGADTASLTIVFTPSEDASGFEYAISEEDILAAFSNGSWEETVEVTGAEPDTVVFPGLISGKEYNIYARAYDAEDLYGSVSSSRERTDDLESFSAKLQFVTDRTAGILVEMSAKYYSYRYHLGTASDRDAFINGTVGETAPASQGEFKRGYTWYDLEPETNYVFYAIGTDRSESESRLYEIPVSTYAEGECADVTVSTEIDVYMGTYTFTPNGHCGKIAAVVCADGTYDQVISSNWYDDIFTMLQSWTSSEETMEFMGMEMAEGGPLTMTFTTPSLSCGFQTEAIILLYDTDGNPCGVKRLDFSTPELDENAPAATATGTVTDITTIGATYTITVGENALGVMFETVDADWFDEFRQSDAYYDLYLHYYLFQSGQYWCYKDNSPMTYTETTGEPGKRYYLALCPMNANGACDEGWGELVLYEYTTAE